MLQTKNMLYTAITRAKNIAILVGSKDILKAMAQNDVCDVRYSGLVRRIKEYYPE
jgi:exodeoxyribonuclease V alpha subunit